MFMATRASLVAVVKGYKGPCKLRCYLVRGPPLVLHCPLSFHFFFPMSSDPTRPPFSQKTAPPVQTGAVPPSQSSMAPASFPGIQYDNSGRPWFRGPGGEWIGSSHFVCCSRLVALISLTPTSSPTYSRLNRPLSLRNWIALPSLRPKYVHLMIVSFFVVTNFL